MRTILSFAFGVLAGDLVVAAERKSCATIFSVENPDNQIIVRPHCSHRMANLVSFMARDLLFLAIVSQSDVSSRGVPIKLVEMPWTLGNESLRIINDSTKNDTRSLHFD